MRQAHCKGIGEEPLSIDILQSTREDSIFAWNLAHVYNAHRLKDAQISNTNGLLYHGFFQVPSAVFRPFCRSLDPRTRSEYTKLT